MTSQRETTSRAVNCLKTTPGTGDAPPEYRPRPGRRVGTPRTAWVCAPRRDGAAAPAAIRALRCAVVPPADLAAGDGGECAPAWKWRLRSAGGGAARPACLCPSGETANAKSKPFLLREKTKSAAVSDADGGSGLPASSNPAHHNAVASDRRSDERSRNGGRSEPRSLWRGSNPSTSNAPWRPGLTPLPPVSTARSEVAFLPEFACRHSITSVTNHSEREQLNPGAAHSHSFAHRSCGADIPV